MLIRSFTLAVPLLLMSALVAAGQATPGTHVVKLNGHEFTLPVGFAIELVAGPPLVNRPITADFDDEGRLYVADSSGSNERVEVQLKTKPHRIVRLTDSRGRGVFDQATVFADKLMFPQGTMWLDGSLYVAAAPSIWELTDTDGDGVADRRVEWFDGKTLTGCANDLHGPYRGPDGWIYWCKGAFARQTYERPDRPPFSTRAAHVFRARPDGTGLEPVITGGMDNPVDLVFTPGGEMIFTTTFFQFPANGQRDGLVHAVYGGIYGKDWDVIHDPAHAWTGPAVLPVLTHLGPAAPAGLHGYESDAFGKDYQHNLFAALFNLQKVTRHVLEPNGASFKTRDLDFVVSNNKDFHPTDVLEDADGSLLIVDTGGWYKLCCPTSQLVKPDVLGAIYRVRRAGATRPDDPRGRAIAWATVDEHKLVDFLGDGRPVVRRRALETLVRRGPTPAVLAALDGARTGSVTVRRHAVWCAVRLDHPGTRELLRRALHDEDESVRQAALHGAALLRQRPTFDIKNATPHNRRAYAEALGRSQDRSAAALLLAMAEQPADRMGEHAVVYALIELGNREALQEALNKSANPRVRRAALIALDQLCGDGVLPALMHDLGATDAPLRQTAWWLASLHPEWGADLAPALRDRLAAAPAALAEREELIQQLARLAKAPAVQRLLTQRVLTAPAPERRLVLDVMTRAELREAPADWIDAVTRLLKAGESATLADLLTTARSLRLPKQPPPAFSAALLKLGANHALQPADRLAALAAVPGGVAPVEPAVFAFLLDKLGGTEPIANRTRAAAVLAQAKLSNEQLMQLAKALHSVGPMELPRLLEAFSRSTDAQVGQALVAALNSAPARTSLRAETLKPLLAKYGPQALQQAEALLASLQPDQAKQQAQLETLLAALPAGDVRRGQAVFNGTKAACAACHTIGYLGGKVGPDLTRVGSIRSERDLLESILFPSASFVRGYEPILITTRAGKQVNGLVRKDEPGAVVLITGANQEVRLPRDEIDEMQPSRVSIMPAGLDQQLTRQELADLVAFLKASR